MPMGLEK